MSQSKEPPFQSQQSKLTGKGESSGYSGGGATEAKRSETEVASSLNRRTVFGIVLPPHVTTIPG